VRRNAVPGGGFVLIYGDITERKRAEAEVREARDTAEKALRQSANSYDYAVDGQFQPVVIRGNRRVASGHHLETDRK
jgi:hypothetical protein